MVKFFLYYLLHAEGYAAQGKAGGLTIQSFRDIPLTFDLVVAQVVGHADWDHALAADKTLFGSGKSRRADIPSVPEQDKLARDVENTASLARSRVTDLRAKLSGVLAWSGVAPDDSARNRTLAALEDSLVKLSDRQSAQERVESLAILGQDETSLKDYGLILSTLEGEQRALDAIDAQKLAYQHIRKYGEPSEREVALKLTNRLRAPVSSSLADLAKTWPDLAQTAFQEVLTRIKGDDDEARRELREEEQRKLAEQRKKLEEDQKKLEKAKFGDGRKHVSGISVADAKTKSAALVAEALAGFSDSEEVEIEIIIRRRTPS